MASKKLARYLTPLIPGKWKLKSWDTSLCLLGLLKWKCLKTPKTAKIWTLLHCWGYMETGIITWENYILILYKIKHILGQQFYSPVFVQWKWKHTATKQRVIQYSQKYEYSNAHSQMNGFKKYVIFNNGILLRNEKEWNINTCNNTDESKKYAEWRKLAPSTISYMKIIYDKT